MKMSSLVKHPLPKISKTEIVDYEIITNERTSPYTVSFIEIKF